MPSVPVWCSILGAQVTLVKTATQHVTQVICPEYEEPGGRCRCQRSARDGGPLTMLLESASHHHHRARDAKCILRTQ